MINDISHLLNEAQLKPALHKDGPMMVIAGAGSEKLEFPPIGSLIY